MRPARLALCLILVSCSAPPTDGAPPEDMNGGGDGEDLLPAGPADDPSTCVYEGKPTLDPATLPSCGADDRCMPSALLPPEAADLLAECEGGGAYCVPTVFISTNAQFVLPTCRTLYEAEGRCVSVAIPLVGEQADLLPQDTCQPHERCAPCYNPFDGSDLGLCSLSCDTGPAEPARTAPKCCENRGSCVPAGLVPASATSFLGERECAEADPGAYLCAPAELLSLTPPAACTGNIPLVGQIVGVCLSNCFNAAVGLALPQGTCGPGNKCVPCDNPLSGEPLGVPGCPAPPTGP